MRNGRSKRYLEAHAALYGNGLISQKYKSRKKPIQHEEAEQCLLVTWLRSQNILFYHIPNGGYRNRLEGFKFKRLGVSPGVPDICIPIPRSSHHGLYIELKRVSGGKVSANQQYWLDKLNNNGYIAYVANGFEEAKEIVVKYLSRSM